MQSNPFGDAKPVDAEAKLRKLEERERKRKVRTCDPPAVLCAWLHSVPMHVKRLLHGFMFYS